MQRRGLEEIGNWWKSVSVLVVFETAGARTMEIGPRVAKRVKIRWYLRTCLCGLIVWESAGGGRVRMEYEMYSYF